MNRLLDMVVLGDLIPSNTILIKNYYNYDKVKDYIWIKIILSSGPVLIKKIHYNSDKKLF